MFLTYLGWIVMCGMSLYLVWLGLATSAVALYYKVGKKVVAAGSVLALLGLSLAYTAVRIAPFTVVTQ
mgnify:CR=1 FL=1